MVDAIENLGKTKFHLHLEEEQVYKHVRRVPERATLKDAFSLKHYVHKVCACQFCT